VRKVAALLAAVAATGVAGCGGGAEPGAPSGATLVLDFQPNAVHAGIYAALAEGYYRDAGISLHVQEPSSSTDAPKLLEAGRADFAIMDIHDLGIARERGAPVVGIAPIVDRPLAAVIAGDRSAVRRPCDLEGRTAGVTGLPSDDAVLDSVVAGDGCDPAGVHRVTIGFNAVSSLAAGRVDAATGFWNAEGVALERLGVPVREFRVDDFGAPRYPELVLATSRDTFASRPGEVRAMVAATGRGYSMVQRHPAAALADLESGASGLRASEQRAELHALLAAHAFDASERFSRRALREWSRWDVEHGVLARPLRPGRAFDLSADG
jgi:NitT/TauT family transport system substrate-binding protein/putative hydroxymethylpyrimidine transport system substrate-binding protein